MTQLPSNIETLVSTLRGNPELPVVFTQNEHTISPGYHITEVKTAVVNSLDCGQGTDQWRELVIQLLDGNAESSGAFMQSATMMSILDQALDGEQTVDNMDLYFEFTPGNQALQKSSISAIDIVNKTITIALATTSAQCKPYERGLKNGKVSTGKSGCCGSAPTPAPASKQACCDSSISKHASCCT